MGYQTGTVGPITYSQDNSGDDTDKDTPINYKPEQFGAPPGAQIITGEAHTDQYVSRGKAYVHNEDTTPEGISFMVYTQAANDSWFFGWHSGAITVTTTFQWYYLTDNALKGGEAFFTKEVPAVLPNAAA
jgi:hypothetical protein